jgi:peptidoglycan/xylan/chitin deacetylase (PgdA/CDA1 family)
MGVAVLVYHDIAADDAALAAVDPGHRPYVLTRARFAEHMALAAARAARATTVGALPDRAPACGFAITFDDGDRSNYRDAFPVLAAHGLRATFFVIAGAVGDGAHVAWSELREMADAGMEIGSHSLTHPFMHRLTPAEVRHEFGRSKALIEDRLGRAVTTASLPRGWEPPGFRELLAECGYRIFCTSRAGLWTTGSDLLAVPRLSVGAGTGLAEFAGLLEGRRSVLWRRRARALALRALKRAVGQAGWQRLRGGWFGRHPAVTVRG